MSSYSIRRKTGSLLSCLVLLSLAGCVPYLAFLGAVPQVVSCRAIDPDTGDAPDEGLPDRFLSSGQMIEVRFSIPMDHETVERVLFFSYEEKSIGGACLWDDERTLLFAPDETRSPSTYTLYIGAAARSKMGIPLRSPYTRTFPTTADRTPPRILECTKTSGAPLSGGGLLEFSLRFSEAIDRGSFYGAFSLFPEIDGVFKWEEEGSRLYFTSADTVAGPVDFSLRLSRECCDIAGNHMEEEFSVTLSAGEEDELEVQAFEFLSPRGSRSVVPDPLHCTTFDRDESMVIVFNGPAALPLSEGIINIQPDPGTGVESGTSPERIVISFDVSPAWQQEFCLTIAGRRYLLKCDGEYSEPVRLTGIAFCNHMEAEPPVFAALEPNCCIDMTSSSRACLQLTLGHSDHSLISAVDLMAALDIWCTNGSAYLQPISIETTESGTTAVFYHFSIERYSPAGLLKILISDALHDSLGNTPEQNIEVSCNI